MSEMNKTGGFHKIRGKFKRKQRIDEGLDV
jgi:hypothetical protein